MHINYVNKNKRYIIKIRGETKEELLCSLLQEVACLGKRRRRKPKMKEEEKIKEGKKSRVSFCK